MRQSKEALKLKKKEWHEKNREKEKERMREWHSKNKEGVAIRMRNWNLVTKYGITQEEYKVMYDNQSGKCAICDVYFDVLHIDHNHTTNEIRGLLCNHCNLGVGNFEESIDRLKSAIEYIKQFNT